MSQPEIQEQIRAARISASPELRARVAAIAAATPAAAPPARPRRELPWRRWGLVAVPAAAAVALAATLTVGLATSGPGSGPVQRNAASPPVPATGGTVEKP